MLANITAPYSAIESLFFDALIAPAIAEMGAAIRAQLQGPPRLTQVCG